MLFRPDVAVHVAGSSEVGGQAFSLIVAITSKWVGASGPCWFMKSCCQKSNDTLPFCCSVLIRTRCRRRLDKHPRDRLRVATAKGRLSRHYDCWEVQTGQVILWHFCSWKQHDDLNLLDSLVLHCRCWQSRCECELEKKKALNVLLISVSKGLWLTESGDFLQNFSLLCRWLNSTWFWTRQIV